MSQISAAQLDVVVVSVFDVRKVCVCVLCCICTPARSAIPKKNHKEKETANRTSMRSHSNTVCSCIDGNTLSMTLVHGKTVLVCKSQHRAHSTHTAHAHKTHTQHTHTHTHTHDKAQHAPTNASA